MFTDFLGNLFIFLAAVLFCGLLVAKTPFTNRKKQADLLDARIKATKDRVQTVMSTISQIKCREHAAKMHELRATLERMATEEKLNERLAAHKAKLSRRNYHHFV